MVDFNKIRAERQKLKEQEMKKPTVIKEKPENWWRRVQRLLQEGDDLTEWENNFLLDTAEFISTTDAFTENQLDDLDMILTDKVKNKIQEIERDRLS